MCVGGVALVNREEAAATAAVTRANGLSILAATLVLPPPEQRWPLAKEEDGVSLANRHT